MSQIELTDLFSPQHRVQAKPIVFALIDDFSNKVWGAANDESQVVRVYGVYTKKGERVYYEGKVRDLETWCEKHGIKFGSKVFTTQVDVF